MQGDKKCTTLLTERLLAKDSCSIQDPTYGITQNDTEIVPGSIWWSCTEWCLAKVSLTKKLILLFI